MIYFERVFWAKALAAADFDAALVRPSRSTLEAAVAAWGDVTLLGDFVCASALPEADFEAAPVALLVSVLDAALAAFEPVVLEVAIF